MLVRLTIPCTHADSMHRPLGSNKNTDVVRVEHPSLPIGCRVFVLSRAKMHSRNRDFPVMRNLDNQAKLKFA